MNSTIEILLEVVGIFFVIYLIIYSSYLLLSILAGGLRLWKRDKMMDIRNELKHEFYYPISVLVPAYNESVNIVDSVKSLLALDYKLYEIIVIDDGSKDNTSGALIEYFGMREISRPIHKVLKCEPLKRIYEVEVDGILLTLIVKENGGKGDALNMGINASKYPWFVCMDADSLLQRDSLEKIIQPVLEDDSVVAVGGMIHVSQVLKMENGIPTEYSMPKNPVVAMQVMEYGRSFLASRILMDTFNGNLIISGAFGLFRKDIVIAAGGYDTDSLGEDMELVVKMHTFCKNNGMKYSVNYEPAAVCWSQVPESLRDLYRQRRRWHLGLFQSLHKYRQMFLNFEYGLLGFVSYMYYLIYELLSPYIEIIGLFFIGLFWWVGVINVKFAIWFLIIYALYGTCLTVTAFFQRVYMQRLKITIVDGLLAIVACILESLVFRYYIAFARATAFFKYKSRRKQWGSIQRKDHKSAA